MSSEAIRGHLMAPRTKRPHRRSVVVGATYREAIRGNQRQSEAIRGNQRQSEVRGTDALR